MDEHAKLERLLADGYLLFGRVISLSELTPGSIANTVSVFSIQLDPEVLLNPSNKAKSLVMLKHPATGHRVEILTADERTIERANEQRRYQEEQIGTLIRAGCAALGDSSPHRRIFHLDRLVASLDGLWGWNFTLGEDVAGTFEVIMRLETTDSGAVEEALDKLQLLLDCLAVSKQVGFHIQHRDVAPIPRIGPAISFGPKEMMLPAVASEEIANIETGLSSTEAMAAARGLNQAYIENCMPSRLFMLWAAAEAVFGSKPEPLLTKEEVKCLLDAAKDVESLRNDSDRLGKLAQMLPNGNRLPLIDRNKRMAHAIAPIMGISVKEAYSKVRTASELRGKHGHQLFANWENIEASENFLQQALRCYLKTTLAGL